jgi:eukaryotic-like serine/threonine-protein kinase
MSDPARTTIPPGTILAGKYRVESVIGSGGMGVVVAATHLELHQRVAVKFLHPNALENEEVAARFVREARAAVKIKSEHVARVIDVGRLEDGAPYMVMEYLEGHDLGEVKHGELIPIEDAIDYVIQACDAMAEAHAGGIVHRDLKPANLFLTMGADGTPVVKVLDFGISKVSLPDMASLSLTKTSTAMGSPLYMSPEQMRSAKTVDRRTDIWSLGVILFELLTGKMPFMADSLPELCAKILAEEPRPLRELRPDVPEGLEAVVLRCLEKDATKRYGNVAELTLALAPFAPRRSQALVERIARLLLRAGMTESLPPPREAMPTLPTGPQASDTNPGARTNATWSGTQPGEPAKRGTTLALIAVVVVALIAAGAWAFGTRHSEAKAELPVIVDSAASVPAAAPPATVEPEATPSSSAVAAPSVAPPTVTPAASPSAPTVASRPRSVATATTKPKTEPKAEPKAEPKKDVPAPPKPKNPLDIGLK